MAAIAAARPHIVWVGLGTPKQDLWMHRLRPTSEGVLAMGVGAAFDFLSGNRPRAPMWMQESGLEWVHRMVHDPLKLAPALRRGEHGLHRKHHRRGDPRHGRGSPPVPVMHAGAGRPQPVPQRAAERRERGRRGGDGAPARARASTSTLLLGRERRHRRLARRRSALTLPARVVWSRDGARTGARARSPASGPTSSTSTTRSRCSARPRCAPRTAPACGSSRRCTTSGRCARPATFLRDGHVCEDCLGRVPLPAVRPRLLPRHRAWRRSRSRVKDAVHSAIGTWRARSTPTSRRPSSPAAATSRPAGRPTGSSSSTTRRPTPAAPRPAYDGGFVCLARLAPEKGVDVLLDGVGAGVPRRRRSGLRDRRRGRAGGRRCAPARRRCPASSSPASCRATRARDPRRSPRARRRRRAGTRCSRGSSPRPTRSACPSSPRGSAASPRSSPTARPACSPSPATPPTSPAPCGAWPTTATSPSGSAREPAREYERNLSPGGDHRPAARDLLGAPPQTLRAAGSSAARRRRAAL